ncbi:MAG: hypothetical protein AAGA11_05330 [Pseudomonadota bacterium]
MNWCRLLFALSFVGMVSACGSTVPALKDSVSENNPFSASGASLRVAVDVYKGGLGTSERDVSEARLAGLIATAKSIFPRFRQTVRFKSGTRIILPWGGENCEVVFSTGSGASRHNAGGCETLLGLSDSYDELANQVRFLEVVDSNGLLSFAHQASNLAVLYARVVLEGRGRRDIGKASARRLLAIANSLRFIADQLDVAVNFGHLAAHNIPLSAQLRATSTENFTDLYGWHSLAASRLENISWKGILSSFSTSGIRTDRDAAVALKMLDERNYWENINQVYASGQGEFSVALIKDAIGNWNVKHFANDPSELLEAQQKLAVSAVELLARNQLPGARELSSAQQVLDWAKGSSTGAASFEADDRIVARLDDLRAENIESVFTALEATSNAWQDLDALKMAADQCGIESASRRDQALKEQGRLESERSAAQESLEALLQADADTSGEAEVDTDGAAARAAIAEKLQQRDDLDAALRQLDKQIKAEDAVCDGPDNAYTEEKLARSQAFEIFYNSVRQQLAESARVLSAVESQHAEQKSELEIK